MTNLEQLLEEKIKVALQIERLNVGMRKWNELLRPDSQWIEEAILMDAEWLKYLTFKHERLNCEIKAEIESYENELHSLKTNIRFKSWQRVIVYEQFKSQAYRVCETGY